MKSLLISLLLIKIVFGYTQTDSTERSFFNVRVAPLALIDVYNGSSYKLGFELRLFKNTTLTSDAGGYFKNFSGKRNCTGYNIDVGLRQYVNIKNTKNIYLGINYFYKNQGFDIADQKVVDSSDVTYRTQKYVTCTNFNIGFIKSYKNRIQFDWYVGLGIRHKKSHSSLTTDELGDLIEFRDSMAAYIIATPGTFLWPNINLGLRISYRII